MPVATEDVVLTETLTPTKELTPAQIEELKKEIRDLYPRWQTLRLELGIKLLTLQAGTAHHGDGTFTKIVTVELGIPHTTAYRLIEFAKGEIIRLSQNGTNDDDPFDEVNMARILDTAYKGKVPRRPKRNPNYGRELQLRFVFFNKDTRLAVLKAWTIVKSHRAAVKTLSATIGKEVLRAAADIEKKNHK